MEEKEPATATTSMTASPSTVGLVWATTDAEKLLLEIARVSSKDPKSGKTGLITYLIKHQHWSPFEMVSMCVEIQCSRVIARQILRHRSFSFQEFSQRYAEIEQEEPILFHARRQDTKNRQNSIDDISAQERQAWTRGQREVWAKAVQEYRWALEHGIAKEQARAVLPEAMVRTRMYMSGTLRSWIHYCDVRRGNGTQKEHQEVALQVIEVLKEHFPTVVSALEW